MCICTSEGGCKMQNSCQKQTPKLEVLILCKLEGCAIRPSASHIQKRWQQDRQARHAVPLLAMECIAAIGSPTASHLGQAVL